MKAVVFDLDNTLNDFVKMKESSVWAAVKAMKKAGLKLSEQQTFDKLFEIYNANGWEDQTAFQKLLEQTLGQVDYKILAHGIIAYRKEKENHTKLYPGVKETLSKLRSKGLKLGVVTDANRLQGYIRLVALGIEEHFDFIICFEDTGERKPSSKPFLHALQKLGLEPSEVLYVGDSITRDIEGAAKAGMKTAWAKYGWSYPEEKGVIPNPDFTLEDIADVLKAIE